MKSIRCEGWRRFGGIFTLGPVRWVQCENQAVVYLKVVQERKTQTLPACLQCWKKGKEKNIKILKVTPIAAKKARG